MNDENQPPLENSHPAQLTTRVGFLHSLLSAILWPVRAPAKWLAIALPAIAIVMLASILFPGAAAIGSPPPRIGIIFSSPFTAYAYQGWMGLAIWGVTAVVISTALAAWCLDAATDKRQPARALLFFGISRGLHFFAGVLAISLTFAPIYLLALVFTAVFGSGKFDLDWQQPRTYIWLFAMLAMVPAFWALFRLLILPPLVTLRGWRGSVGLAWRSTKGFAFRFFCHFVVLTVLAFAFVWGTLMVARTVGVVFSAQGYVILLAGTSIVMSLVLAHWLTILMVLHIPRGILYGDDGQVDVF